MIIGRAGLDGKDGKNGIDGQKGEPGINGRDGKKRNVLIIKRIHKK